MGKLIRILTSDLFASDAQTLVNPGNCAGAMGKGLALALKRRYPAMCRDYVDRCGRGQVCVGEPYLYRGNVPPHVLNFPTKGHWRAPATLAGIVAGLEHLERRHRAWGITALAVPALGCGFGQRTWESVEVASAACGYPRAAS